MQTLERIQKVLDQIETKIESPYYDVNEWAETACLSVFHFQRLFKKLVGKSLKEYVQLRKLAFSTRQLGKKRIGEIAFLHGFDNHETYTRLFKKVYGITPSTYVKDKRWLTHYEKPDLLSLHLKDKNNIPVVFDGMVLEFEELALIEDCYFVGLKEQCKMDYNNPGINKTGELWKKFHKIKSDIYSKYPNVEIGVTISGEQKDSFTYFVGKQVAKEQDCNGFESFCFTKGRYLVCSYAAEDFATLVSSIVKVLNYTTYAIFKKDVYTYDENRKFSLEYYSGKSFKNENPEMDIYFPII